MKILSAEQTRQWDKFTIENEPVKSIDLMERAAIQCAKNIIPLYKGQTIKIFCGKGNNGGDGLSIARLLLNEGIEPEVYILETGKPGSADFEQNLKRLQNLTKSIHNIDEDEKFPAIANNDLVIDALFGTGLDRPLEGLAAKLVNHINQSHPAVIAIDMPSGMFADKSSLNAPVIKAQFTYTFQSKKLCFFLQENAENSGSVVVLNIGLHPEYYNTIDTRYELVCKEKIKHIYKKREDYTHKGTYGHTLIIAGEKGKMGAAILCAEACARSGSGLVSVWVPEEEIHIIQVAVPEAMAIKDESVDTFIRYNSIGIGPGLGVSENAIKKVEQTLRHFKYPIVADADCLNIISKNKTLLDQLPKGSILTPHPKEFERLYGKTANQFERLELALEKASELNCYIILKGFYSFIATPKGKGYFNPTGNPGMATGGSGDVLTGVLAGLLAQGYSPENACLLGVYLHGLAGDIAAKNLSQEAMLAGDIIQYLSEAFKKIPNLGNS